MPLAVELRGVVVRVPARAARARGRRPRARRGRVRRRRRPERRRQDDARARPPRARATERGLGVPVRRAGPPLLGSTPRSGTSPSARRPGETRRQPFARWSVPGGWPRVASSGACGPTIAASSTRRSAASAWTPSRTPRSARSRAGCSSARSSPRRSPGSRPCSCSTSRRPASTPSRRSRSRRCSPALHSELGVTIVYVSHEFGAVEHHVERLVLVRRTIVFDGSPHDLPGVWHDPAHVHARE